MPKFIGRKIADSRHVNLAGDAALVRLSYSQAVLLPAADIYYELDTSDRGSRGSLAKRWHVWYATVGTIESCPRSTPKMLAAARGVRTRALTRLSDNLGRVARHLAAEQEKILAPARLLGANLRDVGAVAVLGRLGLLAELTATSDPSVACDRPQILSVAGDALEAAGASRSLAGVIGAVSWSLSSGRPERVRQVGWRIP